MLGRHACIPTGEPGYHALGFSMLSYCGRTLSMSLLEIDADSTLHLLMLLTRCSSIRLFAFSLALQIRHRRILLRACMSVHYLLRLMFAISASFAVQLFVSANHSRNIPSLESTKTCGLAFQRHVCDMNAHPAWPLIAIHAHDTTRALPRRSDSLSVCLFLMVV